MTNETLRTILPIAGWTEDRARAVEITGQLDPILPTPFKIGETAAAALAAVGLAADRSVGAAHRAPPANFGRYAPRDGVAAQRPLPEHRRRVHLARARPGHGHLSGEERALELRALQFPQPSRGGAQGARRARGPRGGAKAVAQWDAQELEEAIIAANGAGGMVRTMEEWAQHPQGIAVSPGCR
jgi:hypothetical protein